MKTVTNYTPGPKGINMKPGKGSTVWVEPGQSVEINEDDVLGDMPDLGTKPSDDPAADAAATEATIAALRSENDALKAQVADLTAQLDAATSPKK